ncbi:MAG TPA: cupin domain-containing protein [Polyangia bacterium]|jgi:hypothetical protein|nr:cupin domain-containing protein [Polyangia bacterium]
MSELQFLLDPVGRETFFREYWDRRPLHIPGPPDKFNAIYDVATWRDFEGVDDLKAVSLDGQGIQIEMPALPEQAGTLFMAGFTICASVTNAPRLAPFIQAFRRELDVPGGPAFAKLYASGDGRGFAVHADKHHVFVLQVSGKKQWRFSRAPVVAAPGEGLFIGASGQPHWTGIGTHQSALRDDGTPVPPPDVSQFDSALLEPGHLLYLPPGTWHVARAVGHSIAVSISPDRTTVMDLFIRAIQDQFANRADWRQDILAPLGEEAPAGAIPPSVASKLDGLLADLRASLANMDGRLLHRLWMRNVVASKLTGLPPPAPPAAPDEDTIRRSDEFARVGEQPLSFIVAPMKDGGEVRCFFYRGAEWSLPAAARPFLTELARHAQFRAEEALAWDRTMRFDDLRAVLAVLVAAGVLARRPR